MIEDILAVGPECYRTHEECEVPWFQIASSLGMTLSMQSPAVEEDLQELTILDLLCPDACDSAGACQLLSAALCAVLIENVAAPFCKREVHLAMEGLFGKASAVHC